MLKHSIPRFLLFFLLLSLFQNCTADKLPEPVVVPIGFCDTIPTSYTLNVKDIIDTNCAYSGCHLDNAPGDFSNYAGMLGRLDNGEFRERVITIKDDPEEGMPPEYAPPGRPQDLTQEELDIISCWLEAGYPEN